MVSNLGTTGQIQLILVPLDQKFAQLTNRNKIRKFIRKNKREKFLRLTLAKTPILEGRPLTFNKFFFGNPLHPYQRLETVE